MGLVPEPRASDETKFLKGDGTWATPAGGGGGSVDSVNGQVGVVVLTKNDIGLSNVDNTADNAKPVSVHQQAALDLKADLASPALTGVPTAPTAVLGTNTTQIATTEFVLANGGGGPVDAVDVAYDNTTSGLTATDTQAAIDELAASAGGAPAAHAASHAAAGSDPVTLSQSQITDLTTDLADKAPLASPALTGVPTAPTAVAGTNTTQIATTEYVETAIGAGGGSPPETFGVTRAAAQSIANGSTATLLFDTEVWDSSTLWTLGDPGKITFSADSAGNWLIQGQIQIGASGSGYRYIELRKNGGTQISLTTITGVNGGDPTSVSINASHAFVNGDYIELRVYQNSGLALDVTAQLSGHRPEASSGGAVDSVNGQTGVVVLSKSDVGLGNADNTSDVNKPVSTATQTALDLKADLASPALTGMPTAPTATPGTNTTQLATTEYVEAAVAAGGSYIAAQVRKNAVQATVTGTDTKITFAVTVWDTGGLWDAANNRFVVPAGMAGKYRISARLLFASNAVGVRIVMFVKNGGFADLYGYEKEAASSGGSTVVQSFYVADLADGDTMECYGYQSSGGGLNVEGHATLTYASSEFTFERLGA